VRVVSFGEYLTSLVDRNGTNLQQLSYKTRIASGHLSRIASGKRPPPKPAALRVLAEALNVDYVEMLREAGYIDPEMQQKAQNIANLRIDPDSQLSVDRINRMRAAGLTELQIDKAIDLAIDLLRK
jgi:transcriptional regulator with XRE-family HTH domain